MAAVLPPVGAYPMLTDGIAQAYRDGRDRVAGVKGIQELLRKSLKSWTT